MSRVKLPRSILNKPHPHRLHLPAHGRGPRGPKLVLLRLRYFWYKRRAIETDISGDVAGDMCSGEQKIRGNTYLRYSGSTHYAIIYIAHAQSISPPLFTYY